MGRIFDQYKWNLIKADEMYVIQKAKDSGRRGIIKVGGGHSNSFGD